MPYTYIRASTVIRKAVKKYKLRVSDKNRLYYDPYSLRFSVVLRDTIQEICGDSYYSMEDFYNTRIYKTVVELFCDTNGKFDEDLQFGPPTDYNIDSRIFALEHLLLPYIKKRHFVCIVDTHHF